MDDTNRMMRGAWMNVMIMMNYDDDGGEGKGCFGMMEKQRNGVG